MALTDPQSITINAVPTSLPKVESTGQKSVYRSADGAIVLTVSHTSMGGGRYRHLVRIDKTVVSADPFSAQNTSKTFSVYTVIDQPSFGFDTTAIQQIVAGFQTLLSGTLIGRIVGLES